MATTYTHKTYAAIATEVRNLINEPSALFYTDAEIYAWTDYAAREIALNTLCCEKFLTITSTNAAYIYPFYSSGPGLGITETAKNIIHIESVMNNGTSAAYTDTYGLQKFHPRLISHLKPNTSSTTPLYWSVAQKSLFLWPPTNGTAISLDVLYYELPIAYADSTTSPTSYYLPEYMEEYVIWYALAKCYEKAGRPSQAQQYLSIFNSFIELHKTDRFIKHIDSHDMMKLPDFTKVAGQ